MAEQNFSIFNRNAEERLRSPDDLDKFVRVTSPSKWAVLSAFVLLMAGILAWGFCGSVSTSVECMGVVQGGQALCYLSAEEASRLHTDDSAVVGGVKLKVDDIAKVPSSREEAKELLGSDYVVEALFQGNWETQVTFKGDTSSLVEGVPLTTNITTERVAPITLIMGE